MLSMLPCGPMPMAPVIESIEKPPPIHTRFLRPGIPARCVPSVSSEGSVSMRERRAAALHPLLLELRALHLLGELFHRRVALEHVDECSASTTDG